jgi:hypothetical protein
MLSQAPEKPADRRLSLAYQPGKDACSIVGSWSSHIELEEQKDPAKGMPCLGQTS